MNDKATKERKEAQEELMDILMLAAEMDTLATKIRKLAREQAGKAIEAQQALRGMRHEQQKLFG